MGLISNGTTLLDSGALDSGVASGAMTLISTQTASSSATVSFTSGIDSTYKEYIFKFINVLPASDGVKLKFNLSIDGGSNYNVTKTTTNFEANHNEGDSATALTYKSARDLAQSTSDQIISNEPGNDNDQGMSGYMHLFNPSSTTFVKHFISRTQYADSSGTTTSVNAFVAGYCNVTAAIDAVQFKMSSGNIDAGDICLYGIN